jgi:hypothetical protein
MAFRAMTSLAMVWFLVPHEPNVGLGRPSLLSEAQTLAYVHDVVLASVARARAEMAAGRQQEAPVAAMTSPGGERDEQVILHMVGRLRSSL